MCHAVDQGKASLEGPLLKCKSDCGQPREDTRMKFRARSDSDLSGMVREKY
jgi:hypothetical protein